MDGLEHVQDTCNDVENVDDFLELQSKGNREECRPGVARRLALVRWAVELFFCHMLSEEVRSNAEIVQLFGLIRFLHACHD